MIRVSDQYLWSFVLSVFFLVLMVMGAIIVETEAYIAWHDFGTFDYLVITLATWRLTRLFVYDSITRFVREQFFDIKKVGRGYRLEKPKTGPRRLLADMFSCPWCASVWCGAVVLFVYLITPYAVFPLAVLALSGVASFLQLLANLVGHQAERAKQQVEEMS